MKRKSHRLLVTTIGLFSFNSDLFSSFLILTRWNMVKQKHRLSSIITGHEKMVYKMIDGLNMQAENTMQAKKKMKFYNMSDQQDVSFLPESVICPMCPGLTQFDTPRDIW